MNIITLLLIGILFICIGFVFGFAVGLCCWVYNPKRESKELR